MGINKPCTLPTHHSTPTLAMLGVPYPEADWGEGHKEGALGPQPLSGGDFDISSTPPPAFLFQASTIRIKESFVLEMPMGGGWEASVNQHVYYSSLRATCYPGPQTGILEQAGSLGRRH